MSFDQAKKKLLYYFEVCFERSGRTPTEEMRSEILSIVEDIEFEFKNLRDRIDFIEEYAKVPK